MPPAIHVDNLAKHYRLGGSADHDQQMLRDVVAHTATAPWRRMRRRFRPHTNGTVGLSHTPAAAHTSAPSPGAGGTVWSSPPHADPHAKEFWALKNVSFEVQPGEVIGIIGRNGAGKSTLLKVLSRIVEPSRGRIEMRGRVASLLEVGTGFHPELTGRENIYLNGAILGMSHREIRAKFDEIVEFAEIARFIDTPVKRYSSGMYVRLAFAVAAHLEPEILIIDEVLAVGDAAFQQKCMGRVARAASEGRTVLFVSHNMTAVTKLCERAILLSHGRLVASGDVQPVVEKYLQDAVTSDGGIFDLSAHPARNAWHTPIFRELTLRKNGTCGTVFFPNDRVEIELVVEPVAPITLPRVAIAIEDAYGRRITTVASFFGEHLADEISGRTVLRCVIPRLPLGEGRYLISLSIHRRHAGFLDLIDHAAWFTVVWNNNYRNGEPYHPVYGPVLIESTWSIVS